MPQYSIKLCTYDPAIVDAFNRLRKNRKHAAFTHEALKQFLSSEKGGQVLRLMEGKTSEHFSAITPLSVESNRVNAQTKEIKGTNHSSFVLQNDSSAVLGSILE